MESAMTYLSLFDVGISVALTGPVQKDWLLDQFLADQYSLVSSWIWIDIGACHELLPRSVESTPVSVCGADYEFDVRTPGCFRLFIDVDVAYII